MNRCRKRVPRFDRSHEIFDLATNIVTTSKPRRFAATARCLAYSKEAEQPLRHKRKTVAAG
jgi:hypothetical protein